MTEPAGSAGAPPAWPPGEGHAGEPPAGRPQAGAWPAGEWPAGDWQAGWWRPAARRPSPNFGPRPAGTAIELVLLHSISLPPGEYGGDAIERLFTNQLDWDAHPYYGQIRGLQVSAHFLVRRDGQVLQFVSCDQRAWHAGASHWRGRDNCNDWSIGIELEGLEGDAFEPAQYAALGALLAAIAAAYPVGEVAGHEHVAPLRKRDPGPGFDWQALQAHALWPRHWRAAQPVAGPAAGPALARSGGPKPAA